MDHPTLEAILTYSVLAIAIVQVLSFLLRFVPWGPTPTYGGAPVVTGTRTRP